MCTCSDSRGTLDRTPLLSRKQEPVLEKLLSPPWVLRNKQGWTGFRKELIRHPFGLLCPKSLSGGTGRNSPFSLTVTQARVDPSPGIVETEVTLLAAEDPVMEQGTFFIQLQTTS